MDKNIRKYYLFPKTQLISLQSVYIWNAIFKVAVYYDDIEST
jgi:hypothetical protein